MNKNIKRNLMKVKLKFVKHSPEILLGVGAIGMVTSTVLACRATLKLNDIKKEHDVTEEAINEALALHRDDYTEEDAKNDFKVNNVQTVVKIGLGYIPSVLVGGASLACILSAHNIMRNRNAAIAAALATTNETFKRYRRNVIEKYGEDVDKEMRYGLKKDKIITKDSEGNDVEKDVTVAQEIDQYSDYARFFDDGNDNWQKEPEYNLMFLKAQQQYANDRLIADGYLFLNDVYDMLGIPRSKAGQVVGWIYNEENPTGDNFVDFGLYDLHKENVRDFVNGLEPTVLLDFNVDGNIWDLMNN